MMYVYSSRTVARLASSELSGERRERVSRLMLEENLIADERMSLPLRLRAPFVPPWLHALRQHHDASFCAPKLAYSERPWRRPLCGRQQYLHRIPSKGN